MYYFKLLYKVVLVVSLFYAFSALSYEDTAGIRRAIITQNGGDPLTATDSVGRELGGDFSTIMAPVFNPPTNGLRNSVSTYIDARIASAGVALAAKLSHLSMDSALYTHRQSVTFDGDDYAINYSMLVQRNGDYAVLERRLEAKEPIFLAVYYIPDQVYVYQYDNKTTLTSFVQKHAVTSSAPSLLSAVISGVKFNSRDVHLCPLGTLPDTQIITSSIAAPVEFYILAVTNTASTVQLTMAKVFCGVADDTVPIFDVLSGDNDIMTLTSAIHVPIATTITVDSVTTTATVDVFVSVTTSINTNRVQGMLYGAVNDIRSNIGSIFVVANRFTSKYCVDEFNEITTYGAQTDWVFESSSRQVDMSYYWVTPETWNVQFLQKGNFQSAALIDNLLKISSPMRVTFFAVSDNDITGGSVIVFPDTDYLAISNGTTVSGSLLTAEEVYNMYTISIVIPDTVSLPTGPRFYKYTIQAQFAHACGPTGSTICWDNTAHYVSLVLKTELCHLQPRHLWGNVYQSKIDLAYRVTGTMGISLKIISSNSDLTDATGKNGGTVNYGGYLTSTEQIGDISPHFNNISGDSLHKAFRIKGKANYPINGRFSIKLWLAATHSDVKGGTGCAGKTSFDNGNTLVDYVENVPPASYVYPNYHLHLTHTPWRNSWCTNFKSFNELEVFNFPVSVPQRIYL